MIQVRYGHGTIVCQIDGFAADCARSRAGSIHVRPDSSDEVTPAELAHIEKCYPSVFKKLRILAHIQPPAAQAAQEAPVKAPIEEAAAAVPEVAELPAEETVYDSSYGKKKKSRY